MRLCTSQPLMAGVLARDERYHLIASWGGILVPPAAWIIHLLFDYLLVTLACLGN